MKPVTPREITVTPTCAGTASEYEGLAATAYYGDEMIAYAVLSEDPAGQLYGWMIYTSDLVELSFVPVQHGTHNRAWVMRRHGAMIVNARRKAALSAAVAAEVAPRP